MSSTVPLDRFPVLLLDLNSTFMFGEDRFGAGEDFGATYHAAGGRALPRSEVDRVIRAAFAFLDVRYADTAYEDDFPSVAEALRSVAPEFPASERALLAETFARHELGTVPPAYAAALQALSRRHELRLLTNIWAPSAAWAAELGRAGVLSLFRQVVYSSDTRSVKPSRRLVERALAGVACARHEVLVVGDSIARDLVVGRRAGLATLWVSPAARVPTESAALVDFHVPSLLALASTATDVPVA